MSVRTVRGFTVPVVLAAVVGLGGCSGSSSSAEVSASPGAVPQVGQVVATAPLSEGGHEASKCHGVDDVARDGLRAAAHERGWTVSRFSADDQGCWESAEMEVQGQVVMLAVDADQDASTASLRVRDVVPASARPSEG